MKVFFKNHYLFILLSALIFIIYWIPMSGPQTIWVDDDWLLSSIRKQNSISEYFKSYINQETIDRQPIRDLSIFIDEQISQVIGFPIFRLTNVLVWFLCLLTFQKILLLWRWPLLVTQLALLYVGTHPVAVNSVAMLASRKHLLSTLFILICLYYFLKITVSFKDSMSKPQSLKNWIIILVSYFCACLSQPIHVLTPLGFIFFTQDKISFFKKYKFFITVIFMIMIAVLADNYAYYTTESFLKQAGYSKFQTDNQWLRRIYIYGRSVYQMTIPDAPSILPYDLGNQRSLIGLGLMLAFGILGFILTRLPRLLRTGVDHERHISNWGLIVLFFLPLIVVTVKMTEQGGWDTYLLLSLFIWCIFIFSNFLRLQSYYRAEANRTALIFCFLLIIILNISISYTHASYFTSTEKVLQRMAMVEKSNLYRMMYAQMRLNKYPEEVDSIFKEALEVYHSNSKTANLGYVLGRSLVYTKILNENEKLKYFSDYSVDSLWWYYWKAVLNVRLNEPDKAYEIMQQSWEKYKKTTLQDVDSLESILSNAVKMCEMAKRKNCKLMF